MADQPQNPPSDLHNQNPPSTLTPSKPKAKILDKRQCNICLKTVKGIEGLKDHQKKVHGKVAKLNCGVCKKLFISGPDLAYHKDNKKIECLP